MKARKKPVVIDFWVFDECAWLKDCNTYTMVVENPRPLSALLRKIPTIETLEGPMTVNHGDYIIKGVQGEFYPCKPDIFDKTYEIID